MQVLLLVMRQWQGRPKASGQGRTPSADLSMTADLLHAVRQVLLCRLCFVLYCAAARKRRTCTMQWYVATSCYGLLLQKYIALCRAIWWRDEPLPLCIVKGVADWEGQLEGGGR